MKPTRDEYEWLKSILSDQPNVRKQLPLRKRSRVNLANVIGVIALLMAVVLTVSML